MNTSPLKRRSIRSALLLYLVPAGIACLAFAWMMHGQLLDRMPERFLESQLKEEVAFLERRIIALDGDLARLDPGDYLQEVFHHAIAIKTKEATVIVPPNWEPLLAPLFESNQIGLIRATQSALKQIPKQIVAYRQQFVVNQQAVVILVAEDIDAMKQSQSELHAWTAIASILLMGLFVLMLWFGVNYSMRPVTKLQQELDQLKSGEIARISDDAPDEFNALIWQLNQLLDTLETRVAKSREALANLSHSVKTPMTAVRQILVDQQRPLDPMLRTQLATQLEGINTQLEAELRRSRFAGPQIGVSAAPIVKARELIWMFGQLHPEKSFELLSTLEHDVRWPIEEYDLNEVLGNLLDNAGKWGMSSIELRLQQTKEDNIVQVLDDGAGVPKEELIGLGQRGLRLDEQTPGHGIGLAIVQEIVTRYGGKLEFSTTPDAKFCVTVKLPKHLFEASAYSQEV